ncbi:glycosyltransferase [Methylomonas sp. HW2-6]|uniref:glycosyltransferase n=1 Tax=Methylomonas sp. HW2-6 TaxID=3376687 RepID=UPI0040427F05
MIDWSVVVCCYNSEARIKETLHKILAAVENRTAGSVEIIVVDNLCTDRTVDFAREVAAENGFSGLKVVPESRPGLMYARIAGVMASSGRFIAFLDDDNWPALNYFDVAERVFVEHPNLGLFGCATSLPQTYEIPSAIQKYAGYFAIGHLPFESGILASGSSVWGAGMAVRTEEIKAIFSSGFAPILVGRAQARQLAGDDSEIVHAVVISGNSVWYQDDVLVTHAVDPVRFNFDRLIKMHEGIGASELFVYKYSLSARNIPVDRVLVFAIFAARIFFKDIFNIIRLYWAGSGRQNGGFDLQLKLGHTRAKWSCFLTNPEMRRIQDANIGKLISLRRSARMGHGISN